MTMSRLTVSPVLKRVLALEELAGGVVPFTDATCVQGGLRAQNLVTAHRLSKEFAKCFILKSEDLPGAPTWEVKGLVRCFKV